MTQSAVLQFPPPDAVQSEAWLHEKLAYYSDAWDLAQDLANGITDIVVIDTRSTEQYLTAHIPCAISFPHRTMSAETLAALDDSKVYVTYCDGIGCNGSTKGAWKMASAGLRVKELIGGLDFWLRDRHPVAQGEEAGSWPRQDVQACGC